MYLHGVVVRKVRLPEASAGKGTGFPELSVGRRRLGLGTGLPEESVGADSGLPEASVGFGRDARYCELHLSINKYQNIWTISFSYTYFNFNEIYIPNILPPEH